MAVGPQADCAPVKKPTVTLLDYLTQENSQLTEQVKAEKQWTLPKDKAQFNSKKQTIAVMLTLIQAKIDSLKGFLDNQKKQSLELTQKLKTLQQLPLASADTAIQARVANIEKLIDINTKTAEQIDNNLDLADEFKKLLNQNAQQLEEWNANFQLEQTLLTLKKQSSQLKEQLDSLYQTDTSASKIAQQKPEEMLNYETKKQVLNQHIALIQTQLTRLGNQKNSINAKIGLLKNSDSKSLQHTADTFAEIIAQDTKLENNLKQTLTSLETEIQLPVSAAIKQSMQTLKTSIKKQLESIALEKEGWAKELLDYQTRLKKIVSARQSLSEYRLDGWPIILSKMATIPSLFYTYIKTLSLKVYDSYMWLNGVWASLFWAALIAITGVFYLLNRFLKSLSGDKERSRLTGYLYDGILTLIQRNIPYLCLFALLWTTLFFTNISYAHYQLLFNLLVVWFSFRVLILIARLSLLESVSDSSGQDVTLYYRLKWLLLFGGWVTALMVFSHLLPLSMILQDIFNRLFMLFLMAVSLVAWKSKDVIPYLLNPLLKSKKRYIKSAISLLVFLVPITLFTTAVFGLLGYVNLSWTMSRYEVYVLLVLVGYILARGLLFDALELFSEWMISSLSNGWLWIEVFLKPLDTILRLVLIFISLCILFQLFGWQADSPVMSHLKQGIFYPLVQLPGVRITIASGLAFLALVAVFIWASKWTREFCYRWLFINTKDPGIRHSLSVFTQYTVILLGGFITLHVLGLDLTGMSMILGGLAVGMGFGLRDFASNIVGGLMLLIERPVREGDLITLGEHEGQVQHIGIRSMRVVAWDNTVILVPNAETFNKPFINWTHQDGIVRTVIPIKVNRADDPLMVQQLILDVLAITPEIVAEPPAQVFLKKIDEALIEFEVRYFINVQIHTRFEVRSKVLFAITAQFKAAGVRAPVEPLTIEFKEGHGDFFKSPNTTD